MTYQYGYDGASELLRAAKTSGTVQSLVDAYAYQYDPAGNRTVEQIDSSVTTSTYNNLNQMTGRSAGGQLTISGSLSQPGTVTVGSAAPYVTGTGTSFTAVVPVTTGSNAIQISATSANGHGVTQHIGVNVTSLTSISALLSDSNGNLTYDGTMNYVWDSANRLVKIWYGPVSSSSSTTISYDGFGRRIQIVESGSSGAVTSTKNLVWDGMNICEEKNASGAVAKSYFAQGVQISGSDYYYTRDHLGSVRELTDASGTVQARYDYDPYGRKTQVSGTMSADFGFTGDYYHSQSALCLTQYRGYSSGLGRWLSRDPIRNAEMKLQGANLYEYCSNAPLDGIDPSGLFKVYGNYCGPDWTGGHVEPYTPHPPGYYAAPIDQLDSYCRDHDICYYNCRQKYPCNTAQRKQCMQTCNDALYDLAGDVGGFWGHIIQIGMIPPPDPGPDDPNCGKCKKTGN